MIIRKCDKCGKTCREGTNGPIKRYIITEVIRQEFEINCDLCESCYQKVISYIFEQEREEVTNTEQQPRGWPAG